MNNSRILLTRAAPLLAGLLGLTTAHAVPTYTIGNGPDSGNYINAQSLADTMAFTSVTLTAENAVTVADPVDLSTSLLFGPTLFDLLLQAPTVTIDGKVAMGAGNVHLTGQTVNLNDILVDSDGASLLDTTRILGWVGTTTINVNGAGSVDQAVALAFDNIGTPATLNLLGGNHPGESLQALGSLAATMSGGSVGGATISGGGLFDWTGGQILDGVLQFSGTFNIYGAGFQVAPWGNCATTPEASWQAAPTQLNNQAQCVRGIFADGSTFRTAVNSMGTTNFIGVSVVPVPAAVWLFGSAMAGLGFLRRRGSVPPGQVPPFDGNRHLRYRRCTFPLVQHRANQSRLLALRRPRRGSHCPWRHATTRAAARLGGLTWTPASRFVPMWVSGTGPRRR